MTNFQHEGSKGKYLIVLPEMRDRRDGKECTCEGGGRDFESNGTYMREKTWRQCVRVE